MRFIQKILYGKTDHLQTFSFETISSLLTKNGFSIKKMTTDKGSLEILKDPRGKIIFSLLTKTVYPLIKFFYYKDQAFNILAIKEKDI